MKCISKKDAIEEIRSWPRDLRYLSIAVLLIGMHSFFLGIIIFFFTELFYQSFFLAKIENFFFVRQAGLFLFCLGLFNLAILVKMKRNYHLVKVIIATKVLAVLFLVSHAYLVTRPPVIWLAAFGDGIMAILLIFFYRRTLAAMKKNA